MDNVHISTHFFFVPNRLIWNNWERFNGEQDNPGDSTDYSKLDDLEQKRNCRLTAFGRLSTPIFPIMDNVHISTHFFFVPNRLVWNNWERFNGEQDNPRRPHYHALIFGYDFPDRVLLKKSKSGDLFTSEQHHENIEQDGQ
jgi:hypothetical protein